MLLFSALINVAYLAPTLYMLQVYARVIPSASWPTLVLLTLALAATLLLLTMLDQLRQRIMLAASVRLDRVFSVRIFRRLMTSGAGGQKSRLTQTMREFDSLRAAVTGPAALAAFDAPWIPIYIAVCFVLHWSLGALALCGASWLLCLAFLNERAARAYYGESARASTEASAMQEAVAGAADSVRALGMGPAFVEHFESGRQAANLPLLSAQHAQSRIGGLIRFSRLFLQSAALGLGAWLVINRAISPGAIFAASMLVTRALSPIDMIVAQWRVVQTAITSYGSLRRLLSAAPERERTALPAPQAKLVLDGASALAPSRDRYLLHQISFAAEGGVVVGVLGPSGAGKSTLLQMIANARPPDQGEVRLDGARMSEWEPERLGRHVGYLPQDCALFPGTVKDNISRFDRLTGRPAADVDAMAVSAAKSAGVHDLVLSLADGYDTVLGFRGAGLSAGQQQRIAFARALYGEPRLYVLDEPNASLDAPGEMLLMQAIDRLRRDGALVILSAHRLPLIGMADVLAVLRDGRLEQYGPRQKVLDTLRGADSRPRPAVVASAAGSEDQASPAAAIAAIR